MELQNFTLGDIVALKPHPYKLNTVNIVISGDATPLPPLMVVVEIVRIKHNKPEGKADISNFKYKCLWFSTKSFRFLDAWIFESDLKIIEANNKCVDSTAVKRGDQLILKTSSIELAKRKSSQSHDDQSSASKNGTTVINSLLTFLAPPMSVIEVKQHVSKNPLVDKKTGQTIRWVSASQVKCLLYDPIAEKISELVVPLEAMDLVEQVDQNRIAMLSAAIERNAYLWCTYQEFRTIIKPTHLSCRAGKYYARAYDYVLNRMTEIDLLEAIEFSNLLKPFISEIPTFDVERHPEAGTIAFMHKEKLDATIGAQARKNYLRIKYKDQNDLVSYRTLRNYRIAQVTEETQQKEYIIGFCMLRQAERTFKVDRIQNLSEMHLAF